MHQRNKQLQTMSIIIKTSGCRYNIRTQVADQSAVGPET